MVRMLLCGRRLNVSSDDLSGPSCCAAAWRLAMLGLFVALIVSAYAAGGGTADACGTAVTLFLYFALGINALGFALDVLLARCSGLGTLADDRPRKAVPHLLAARLVLSVIDVVIFIVGLVAITLGLPASAGCPALRDDHRALYAALLACTITTIALTAAFMGTAGLFWCCGTPRRERLGALQEAIDASAGRWGRHCRGLASSCCCRVGASAVGDTFESVGRVLAVVFSTAEALQLTVSDLAAGLALVRAVQKAEEREQLRGVLAERRQRLRLLRWRWSLTATGGVAAAAANGATADAANAAAAGNAAAGLDASSGRESLAAPSSSSSSASAPSGAGQQHQQQGPPLQTRPPHPGGGALPSSFAIAVASWPAAAATGVRPGGAARRPPSAPRFFPAEHQAARAAALQPRRRHGHHRPYTSGSVALDVADAAQAAALAEAAHFSGHAVAVYGALIYAYLHLCGCWCVRLPALACAYRVGDCAEGACGSAACSPGMACGCGGGGGGGGGAAAAAASPAAASASAPNALRASLPQPFPSNYGTAGEGASKSPAACEAAAAAAAGGGGGVVVLAQQQDPDYPYAATHYSARHGTAAAGAPLQPQSWWRRLFCGGWRMYAGGAPGGDCLGCNGAGMRGILAAAAAHDVAAAAAAGVALPAFARPGSQEQQQQVQAGGGGGGGAAIAVVVPSPPPPMLPQRPPFHRSDVLHASHANALYHVPWFVAVDRPRGALVVSMRGTLSLTDCLTDAAAEPLSIRDEVGAPPGAQGAVASGGLAPALRRDSLDLGDVLRPDRLAAAAGSRRRPGAVPPAPASGPFVHAGMWRAAKEIRRALLRHGLLETAYAGPGALPLPPEPLAASAAAPARGFAGGADNKAAPLLLQDHHQQQQQEGTPSGATASATAAPAPPPACAAQPVPGTLQLVLCGHSLGAGVASLLSLLLRPYFPSLRCYAYSPPGAVVSPDLARLMEAWVTSVVIGKDVVPRMTLSALRGLVGEMADCSARCRVSKNTLFATAAVAHLARGGGSAGCCSPPVARACLVGACCCGAGDAACCGGGCVRGVDLGVAALSPRADRPEAAEADAQAVEAADAEAFAFRANAAAAAALGGGGGVDQPPPAVPPPPRGAAVLLSAADLLAAHPAAAAELRRPHLLAPADLLLPPLLQDDEASAGPETEFVVALRTLREAQRALEEAAADPAGAAAAEEEEDADDYFRLVAQRARGGGAPAAAAAAGAAGSLAASEPAAAVPAAAASGAGAAAAAVVAGLRNGAAAMTYAQRHALLRQRMQLPGRVLHLVKVDAVPSDPVSLACRAGWRRCCLPRGGKQQQQQPGEAAAARPFFWPDALSAALCCLCARKRVVYEPRWARRGNFDRILVSADMLREHLPDVVQEGLQRSVEDVRSGLAFGLDAGDLA